jgi:hypothetical protein
MATTVFTPELHPVFNELDRIGLLLGLPRLEAERNSEYRRRLFDVLVNRAGSSYCGLINGITRELGLRLFDALVIRPTTNPSTGLTIGANPAVVFAETKCYVWDDITDPTSGLDTTIDRFEQTDGGYTLGELVSAIENTGLFECSIPNNLSSATRSMTIFNQSTVITVPSEELDTSGARIKLKHDKLIPTSVSVRSGSLVERVDSVNELLVRGQYYIDMANGIIYTTVAPSVGSVIRYQYRNDDFTAVGSPVIIHNLQSNDFRSKMFDQVTLNGETTNGATTPYGLDLINELLSVYPLGWGI